MNDDQPNTNFFPQEQSLYSLLCNCSWCLQKILRPADRPEQLLVISPHLRRVCFLPHVDYALAKLTLILINWSVYIPFPQLLEFRKPHHQNKLWMYISNYNCSICLSPRDIFQTLEYRPFLLHPEKRKKDLTPLQLLLFTHTTIRLAKLYFLDGDKTFFSDHIHCYSYGKSNYLLAILYLTVFIASKLDVHVQSESYDHWPMFQCLCTYQQMKTQNFTVDIF